MFFLKSLFFMPMFSSFILLVICSSRSLKFISPVLMKFWWNLSNPFWTIFANLIFSWSLKPNFSWSNTFAIIILLAFIKLYLSEKFLKFSLANSSNLSTLSFKEYLPNHLLLEGCLLFIKWKILSDASIASLSFCFNVNSLP